MTRDLVSARITDQAIQSLQQRIGEERPLPIKPVPGDAPGYITEFYTEVTRDNIRIFAWSIGDDNPLWVDDEYASKTRWGSVVAPPMMARTFGAISPQGLPGIHAQYAGNDWMFHRPLRVGDQITATSKLVDLYEMKSRFARRTFMETRAAIYRDSTNKVVAQGTYYFIRHERDSSRKRGKYSDVKPKIWTPEELKEIEEAYENENRRGSVPRYWEEVQIGDSLPAIVKGPLTMSDIIWELVATAGVPWSYAFGMSYKLRKRHPGMFIRNTQGVPETITSVHWDWDFARRIGAPAPFAMTSHRLSCLGQLVTDWIGDDGFLKELKGQSRRFWLLGDVTWFKGKVANKYIQDGDYVVELEVWGEDQRGDISCPGWALVSLPTRSSSD